jgi:hypothetical protein
MESNITIKADMDEMNKFFNENDVCSVRYFKLKSNGTFDAVIRHAERKYYLSGTYTIPQIIKELQSPEAKRPVTVRQMESRIRRTEAALRKEHIRNVEIMSRVGWGAGMRRVNTGPSGRREREL